MHNFACEIPKVFPWLLHLYGRRVTSSSTPSSSTVFDCAWGIVASCSSHWAWPMTRINFNIKPRLPWHPNHTSWSPPPRDTCLHVGPPYLGTFSHSILDKLHWWFIASCRVLCSLSTVFIFNMTAMCLLLGNQLNSL